LRRNVHSKRWYALNKANGSVAINRITHSVQRVTVGLQGYVY